MQAQEIQLQLPNCEYTLRLALEPTVKTSRAAFGTALGPSMVAALSDRVPGYRIECQGFSSLPPGAHEAMIGDTENQIASLGLRELNKPLKQTRLGVMIEFSGLSDIAGQPLVPSGRNLLG
jgi:hypothetical protein